MTHLKKSQIKANFGQYTFRERDWKPDFPSFPGKESHIQLTENKTELNNSRNRWIQRGGQSQKGMEDLLKYQTD